VARAKCEPTVGVAWRQRTSAAEDARVALNAPEVAGALVLHLECSDFVAVPGGGDHRISQESFSLLELRLPLVDVGPRAP